MKKLILCLAAAVVSLTAAADEGMWLLPYLQKMNIGDMKAKGCQLTAEDIYSVNHGSLKDAIVIFGNGCTGEVVSPEGLVFTNHHCGYGSIQALSSVEHDYLKDGFWAMSNEEELPAPGLTVTFIRRIIDVTPEVLGNIPSIAKGEERSEMEDKNIEALYEKLRAENPGMTINIQPFFGGNQYFAFVMEVYRDIRLVGTPPTSIGKFGGETDNWMWPRHTGDFSMFRIYADKDGNPAEYSAENVPLKVKKHLTISLKGLQEGDYAMIMGFPGSTSRYLTESEVRLRMEGINVPRITVREERQNILRKEMAASDKVRIQYASKFAGSSNYWKNSIGMNKAIVDNKVLETKAEQEAKFAAFAKEKQNADYAAVVGKINEYVKRVTPLRTQLTYFTETFRSGIEFTLTSKMEALQDLATALQKNKKKDVEKAIATLKEAYADIHNKDYDHEVDRKVAKVLLPLYAEKVPAEALPDFYQTVKNAFKGDYNAYVDALYNNSIFANEKNFNAFIENPTVEAINKDLSAEYAAAVSKKYKELADKLDQANGDINLLHKTYVRGLCEMYAPTPKAPDANFTIRLTYGNVKAYDPKDGVHYKYYTTLKGVMEKEDPNNPEFVVPAKLKELYATKNYGRYALPNGEMPTCFLTTNDITGGNSGSPVMNGNGELIGAAFDGNWESLSGDINFDNNLQRCIAVDIRYVLFIVEKLGGCKNLIDEMTIVE